MMESLVGNAEAAGTTPHGSDFHVRSFLFLSLSSSSFSLSSFSHLCFYYYYCCCCCVCVLSFV
jgi:hypothetical protein